MNSGRACVSVIIPVYNPGKAILRCIHSFQNQSLTNIEIVFIDDCGTDDAIDLVQNAAKNDPRIVIYHNSSNQGAGCSRNNGIKIAKGEYLAFADPDDYVDKDFLAQLYNKAKNTKADVIKGIRINVENGKQLKSYNLNDAIRKGVSEGRSLYTLFTYEHTTAIYSKKMIDSKAILYGSSSNAEDTVFLQRVCCATQNIAFEDKAIYYYVFRKGSSVGTMTESRIRGEYISLQEKIDSLSIQGFSTKESTYYMITLYEGILRLLLSAAVSDGLLLRENTWLSNLKESIVKLPNSDDIIAHSIIIKALVKDDINLSIEPYINQWYKIRFEEYKRIVATWTKYARKNPEIGEKHRSSLMFVYENAIRHASGRKQLTEIRKLARQLPDKRLITGEFVSMRLFVDMGINMFRIRDTSFGAFVKTVFSFARRIKHGFR